MTAARPGRGGGRRKVHGKVPVIPEIPPDLNVPPSPPPKPMVPEIPSDLYVPTPRLTIAQGHDLRDTLDAIGRREKESLRLFEAMPEQERFLASEASERIVRGGNRGGKTLVGCVDLARALTGQDPYDKYDREGVIAIVVGKDLRHCARVLYKKLFKPGPFQIIPDAVTGKWRAFRPSEPADAMRAHEARDAPPLIPRRFYEFRQISWEDKKEEIAKCVPFKNGSALHFFSSLSAPPQGWNVHLIVFDEEIEHPLWGREMPMRLMDNRKVDPVTGKVRNGKFVWLATPQNATQHLYDLCARAAAQRELAAEMVERGQLALRPLTEEFVLGMLDNSYMSEGAKIEAIEKIGDDEDEYRVRVLGDFALKGMRVYGTFSPRGVHGIDPFPIPDTWTRYAFVDPGRQVCAVLFVAIPPPDHELAGSRIIYDELYIKRCNAAIFAQRMQARCASQVIEAWWIDHRAGRMTEIGSGKTPEEQYSSELKALGVRCERSGHNFGWASDDVVGGLEAVRTGLHVMDGRSQWRVFRNLKNFLAEADKYSFKRTPTGVVTDEPIKLNDHLMDCWRYAAMERLPYVKPRHKGPKSGYTNAIIKAKRDKARKANGWGGAVKLG